MLENAGKIGLMIVFFCGLVSQMPAQPVLQDGEIPKDLVIELNLGGTIQFSTHYTYKMTSDGKVFYEEQSNLPPVRSFSSQLFDITGKKIAPRVPKKPKLKDKLSKKQIKEIILDFEKSGFFEMDERYEGDKTLKEIWCINHAEAKGLSISANGKTKKVWFFLGCSYGEKSPLKSFLSLYDKIAKELSGVKKVDLKTQKTNAHRKNEINAR